MNPLDYFYSLPYEERSRIRRLAQQALDAYDMDAEDDDPPRNINDYLSDNKNGWLAKYLNENKKGWDATDSDGDTGQTKIASFGDFVNTGATAGSPGFETWTGAEGSDYEGLSRNIRVGTSQENIEDTFDDWAESAEGARQRMLYMREQNPEGAQTRDDEIDATTERLRLEAEAKANAAAEAAAAAAAAAAGDDDDKKPKYDLAYQRANGVDETGRRLTYAEYFDKFGGDPPPGGWESKYGENGDWLPGKLPEDDAAAAAAAAAATKKAAAFDFGEYESEIREEARKIFASVTGNTGAGLDDIGLVPGFSTHSKYKNLDLNKLMQSPDVPGGVKAFWYNTVLNNNLQKLRDAKKAAQSDLDRLNRKTPNDPVSRSSDEYLEDKKAIDMRIDFADRYIKIGEERVQSGVKGIEDAYKTGNFTIPSNIIDQNFKAFNIQTYNDSLRSGSFIEPSPSVGEKGGDFTDPLTDLPTDVTEAQKAAAAAVAEQQRPAGPASAEGETFEERMARLAEATTPMGLEQLRGELYGLQSPFQQFTRLGATGEFLTDAAGNPIQTPQLSQFGQQGVQDYFNRFIEPRYALELAQASQQALGGLAPQFQPGFEEFARGAPSLGRLSGEQLRAQQADLLATLQDRTRTTDPYRQELLSYLGDLEDPTNKRLIGALAAPTLGQMSPYFRSDARDRIAQQLTYAMLAQPERSLLSLFSGKPIKEGFQDYLSPAAVSSFTPGGLGG